MSGQGWNFWLYLAACIGIPAAWGLFSAWLFARIDRRRAGPKPPRPTVDYTI